jgi:hypothetical protein
MVQALSFIHVYSVGFYFYDDASLDSVKGIGSSPSFLKVAPNEFADQFLLGFSTPDSADVAVS